MKLYELTQHYLDLMDQAEEMDVETFRDTIESIHESIEIKAENMAKMIKAMQGDIKILKEEEARISARRKSLENKVSSLKNYLQEQFERMGIDKVKSPTITISIQNNPPSVEIINPRLIPPDFLLPQVPIVNKQLILERLKIGEMIDGCGIKQTKGIRIR